MIRLVLLFLLIAQAGFAQEFPYALRNPDRLIELPEILNEVSGLTDIDNDHVACVQDELGIVFIYNFKTEKIVKEHRFDETGDFEGLTYTGKALYILRSDGRLTEWEPFDPVTAKGTIRHYKLPLQTANNEGLCHDQKNNALLIAAKSKPLDHDYKEERYIYKFDLGTRKFSNKPLYSLNTRNLAASYKRIEASHEHDSLKKPFNFRPASLSIHPMTNDIYLISASDKMLIVLSDNGKVRHMEKLDDSLFVKAEGITFLSDGTMIITNEAAGKRPNLMVFNMRK